MSSWERWAGHVQSASNDGIWGGELQEPDCAGNVLKAENFSSLPLSRWLIEWCLTLLFSQTTNPVLKQFSEHPKLALTDSVFVTILSYGGMGTNCGTDDEDFEIDTIFHNLKATNCPAMKDKPKIIIIQDCREGDSHLSLCTQQQTGKICEFIASMIICSS